MYEWNIKLIASHSVTSQWRSAVDSKKEIFQGIQIGLNLIAQRKEEYDLTSVIIKKEKYEAKEDECLVYGRCFSGYFACGLYENQ